jgi:hypothetical protein
MSVTFKFPCSGFVFIRDWKKSAKREPVAVPKLQVYFQHHEIHALGTSSLTFCRNSKKQPSTFKTTYVNNMSSLQVLIQKRYGLFRM